MPDFILELPKTTKLFATVLAVLLFALTISFLVRRSNAPIPPMSLDQVAETVEQNGEMSKQEYLRCDRIDTQVEKDGRVSPADLDWLLLMLGTTSNSNNPDAGHLRRADIAGVLKDVKNLTLSQKDRVYHAVFGLLSSPISYDRVSGIAVIRALKDKRALPALTGLLGDSDPLVRDFAAKTIRSIDS